MGRYEISALPWSSHQRICRWNFIEFWQVSGSAAIDKTFHNQFEWAPCTNGVTAATPLAPATYIHTYIASQGLTTPQARLSGLQEIVWVQWKFLETRSYEQSQVAYGQLENHLFKEGQHEIQSTILHVLKPASVLTNQDGWKETLTSKLTH